MLASRCIPRLAAIRAPLAPLAPLAESSRQAQVRQGQQVRASLRRYSAAVAEAESESMSMGSGFKEESRSQAYTLSTTTSTTTSTTASITTSTAPPPTPANRASHSRTPVDAPLTAGERFSRKIKLDPLGALFDLGTLGPDDLATVDIKDIRRMLFLAQAQVGRKSKPSARTFSLTDATEARRSLRAVLSVLFATAPLGKKMRGNLLRAFLRLCINLRCSRIARETVKERLDEQVRTGATFVDVSAFALDLAAAREWATIVNVFSGVSERLPQKVWTAEVVSIVIRANIARGRPQAAVDIFTAAAQGSVEPAALCGLITAYLELGDIPAAQQTADYAHKHGIAYRDVQLAILRGYRSLGFDADVEARVRRGFEQLGIPLEAPVLNAFIRLRVDAADFDGAERILAEFRMNGRSHGAEPNVSTAVLALSVDMRLEFDAAACVRKWNEIVDAHPGLITDASVTHLCRMLAHGGLADDAFALFTAAVQRTDATPYKLPAEYSPGVTLANTVLDIRVRAKGYDGLIAVTRLMTQAGIEPNERTLVTVLEFAASSLTASPQGLQRLLDELHARTDTAPTADQISIIVTEAIRSVLRLPAARTIDAPSDADTGEEITAGASVTTAPPALSASLRALLEDRIEMLRKDKPSYKRTLRTRLMYDALALGEEPSRAIRSTWQAFVLRGYRPGAGHYLSLMRAYANIGAFEDAEDVLSLVEADGIAPTGAMYTTLIAMYRRAGNIPCASTWYEEARRAPDGPDPAALTEILNAYTLAGRFNDALALARRDYTRVTADENVVLAITHTLRQSQNVPGAVFFVAYHTRRRDYDPATAQPAATTAPHTLANTRPEDARPTLDPSIQYVLTPRLRKLVRKMINYLGKQDVDSAGEGAAAALRLAQDMIADDKVARPRHLASRPRLGKGTTVSLAERATAASALDNEFAKLRLSR